MNLPDGVAVMHTLECGHHTEALEEDPDVRGGDGPYSIPCPWCGNERVIVATIFEFEVDDDE